jgi:5-methyltetrahydrofolate--homocysteine methyltransferase
MSARQQLLTQAAQRILITDGAFGTEIQNWKLSEADYAGSLGLSHDQKGNNDILALTKPEVLESITQAYLDAGSDIISTNTFSANSISQADYGAEHLVQEINLASARLARKAADAMAAKDGRPRFVAGAIGPTNKTLSLSPDVNDPGYREITFDYLKGVYREQVDALVEGGVDFILIETVFDTLNAKAGIMAVLEAEADLAARLFPGESRGPAQTKESFVLGSGPGPSPGNLIPMMISMTLTDLSGRNLSGHTVEAFWCAVRHAKPVTIGLNCSFGAQQLRPHVKVLSAAADTLIMVYPNAGLPNDLGEYDELPEETAALVREWAEAGQVNILGGCCGSTPAHIAAMARTVKGLDPRMVSPPPVQTRLAGLEPMVLAS